MNITSNNQRAFPYIGLEWRDGQGYLEVFNPGMTLRDYFAAKAMQAALAGCATRGETVRYPNIVSIAYELADAMLEARK